MLGFQNKDLVEILDETKQGRCSSTFVDDIGHGSNASVCVSVCALFAHAVVHACA